MLEEIERKAKIDQKQVRRITEFLKEYDFISLDETKKKAKLDKIVQEFLSQTTTS